MTNSGSVKHTVSSIENLMTIIVSLISSVIAAFLAYYLATLRMKRAELSKFQIEAYSNFTAAAARLAVARSTGDTTDENIDLAALNDAGC